MWLLKPIEGEPFKYPPPAFQPGDRVWYEGDYESGEFTVIGATHTHVELEGKGPICVSAWRCTRVKKRRKSSDGGKSSLRKNTDDRIAHELYDPQKAHPTPHESKTNSSHPTGESYRYFLKPLHSLSFRL